MATANQESTSAGSARDALAGIKVIDVDTHLTEPHDLWTSRAPAKWKERVPQVKMVEGKRAVGHRRQDQMAVANLPAWSGPTASSPAESSS